MSKGSLPRPARKGYSRVNPTAATALKAVRHVASATPAQLKAAYGNDLRGVLQHFMDIDGTSRFFPDVRLIYKNGRPRALFSDGQVIDLDDPSATNHGRRIFNPSNMNSVLAMGRARIAEEIGNSAFMKPSAELTDCARAAGLSDQQMGAIFTRKLAVHLHAACVAELYSGEEAHEAPLYDAIRKLPISIRNRCEWIVDPRIDYETRRRGAQLLQQFSLSALGSPAAVQAIIAAGVSIKEAAARLGFYPETPRLRHSTLSPVNRFTQTDVRGEELSKAEIDMLSPEFLNGLANAAFRQKIAVELLLRTGQRFPSDDAMKVMAGFANAVSAGLKSPRDLPEPDRVLLADYAAAPAAFLKKFGLEPLRANMSLETALERANAFLQALIDSKPGKASWKAPAFSPTPPAASPHAAWKNTFIGEAALLHWLGTHLRNCAASYCEECRTGETSIHLVWRAVKANDLPERISDVSGIGPCVIGGLLELRPNPSGVGIREVQFRQKFNSADLVPESAKKFVRELIEAANAANGAAKP